MKFELFLVLCNQLLYNHSSNVGWLDNATMCSGVYLFLAFGNSTKLWSCEKAAENILDSLMNEKM